MLQTHFPLSQAFQFASRPVICLIMISLIHLLIKDASNWSKVTVQTIFFKSLQFFFLSCKTVASFPQKYSMFAQSFYVFLECQINILEWFLMDHMTPKTKKSAFSSYKYIFKYIQIENRYIILWSYFITLLFYCICHQMSRRVFQKQSIIDPNILVFVVVEQ